MRLVRIFAIPALVILAPTAPAAATAMSVRQLFFSKIRSYALFALSLTLSMLVQMTPASAILIDFETYPGGAPTSVFDPVDTEFSSWGISNMESRDPLGDIASPVIGQLSDYPVTFYSGISALAPHPGDDTTYGFAQAPITVYFSSPLDYFSVWAMDVGYNGLRVEAFDVNSALISYVEIDGTGRNHDGLPGCQIANGCFSSNLPFLESLRSAFPRYTMRTGTEPMGLDLKVIYWTT
jgi:hypothetical protein